MKSSDHNNSISFVNASRVERLIAFIIDEVLIFILPLVILMNYWRQLGFTDYKVVAQGFYILYLAFIFKDIYGRSPGKMLLKLYIVKTNDYTKRINPLMTIIRNIFIPVFFIEVIVSLIDKNGYRLGDMVTKSHVVIKIAERKEIAIEDYPDNTIEPIKCIECGNMIPTGEVKCLNCGWSYK